MLNFNSTSILNAWSSSLAESVPSCSCPPETSDTAICTDEVDGGILFFNSYPVNGSFIPLNLE